MYDLVIYNIGCLATPYGDSAKSGNAQRDVKFSENAYIAVQDGLIKETGTGEYPEASEYLDAEGCLVTPGLIDAHTHLVFGGWRQNEMKMKLENVPYLDILNAGGGIHSTVKATRSASKEELTEKALKALDEMIGFGTTTCEAKSGYGLSLEEEVKQLEVIRDLNRIHAMDVVPTFMAAHAVPEEYRQQRSEYIRLICEEMIPYVSEHRLAEYCDVFCEKDVFDAQESKQILETGKKFGLRAKIHADEIETIGGSVLAGEIGAVSAEHLIVCDQKGIEALAKGGTVACLLPATSFYLGAKYAKAREMIRAGVPVAMASDFNPGSCPCLNMQFVMNLGCLRYKMTPEEVLTAVTLNAAAAIGRAAVTGTAEPGKYADLVIWDAKDLNYLMYRLGSNLARKVIKKGSVAADHEKVS